MRGILCIVGLILLFTTLTEGSAFRHSTRKQWKNSFTPFLRKPNHENSLGKYFLKESIISTRPRVDKVKPQVWYQAGPVCTYALMRLERQFLLGTLDFHLFSQMLLYPKGMLPMKQQQLRFSLIRPALVLGHKLKRIRISKVWLQDLPDTLKL